MICAGDAAANVSRETSERLECLCRLIQTWSSRINLVSRQDLGRLWTRHVVDCLQLVPHIPVDCRCGIDMGSGAGFPGLVLAIATGIEFNLIESDKRKAAFLHHAAEQIEAPVNIHAVRLEHCVIPPVTLLTARALASLPRLLHIGTRFLLPSGVMLLLKGRNWQAELTTAQTSWRMHVKSFPSQTEANARLLHITDIRSIA